MNQVLLYICLLLGQSFTENGKTYFKFKDFWKFLIRTKSWPEKRYPKNVTARMLEKQFGAVIPKTNEFTKLGKTFGDVIEKVSDVALPAIEAFVGFINDNMDGLNGDELNALLDLKLNDVYHLSVLCGYIAVKRTK